MSGPRLPLVVLAALSASLARPASPLDAGDGPIVLELFTSQGCSSCPPAERVLSRLGSDDATRERVVPLAFHVDYWDGDGWRDPFGSARWTSRQASYERALGLYDSYTPQLVVNGRSELSGADARAALAAIEGQLRQPAAARVSLAVRAGAGSRELLVDAAAELLRDLPAARLELLVALFESGLETRVARGENAGLTLRNDFVVRRLETAFALAPRAGTRERREVALRIDPAWRRERLGVAAFLQDPRSLRIHAAAVARGPI